MLLTEFHRNMRWGRLPCNQINFDLSDEPFHSDICVVREEWFLVLVLSIVEVGTDQFCQPAVMLKLGYIKGRETNKHESLCKIEKRSSMHQLGDQSIAYIDFKSLEMLPEHLRMHI